MYPYPVHTCPRNTSTQDMCIHRKPTGANLHPSVYPSTRLCTHIGPFAYMSTQVLTYMLGRVRNSGGPLALSKGDTIPSSLWSCWEIWYFEALFSCSRPLAIAWISCHWCWQCSFLVTLLASWAYGDLENRDSSCTIAIGQKPDFCLLGPRAQLGQ